MRRYIILATAVLAAILVMSLIKAWQARRAKARGEELKSGAGIGFEHVIGALVGLDCSWAQIEDSVNHVMRRTRLQPRTLPLLLAANPVNWGKPGKLTTIEALAAALYLMGQNRQATELLSKFRWGEQFMNLNKEPLRAYTEAKSSAELVSLQFEFFDIEVEDDAQ